MVKRFFQDQGNTGTTTRDKRMLRHIGRFFISLICLTGFAVLIWAATYLFVIIGNWLGPLVMASTVTFFAILLFIFF
jgi:hypothetical protein